MQHGKGNMCNLKQASMRYFRNLVCFLFIGIFFVACGTPYMREGYLALVNYNMTIDEFRDSYRAVPSEDFLIESNGVTYRVLRFISVTAYSKKSGELTMVPTVLGGLNVADRAVYLWNDFFFIFKNDALYCWGYYHDFQRDQDPVINEIGVELNKRIADRKTALSRLDSYIRKN